MSKLSKLQEQFDKVLIRYTHNTCEVMLVDGLNTYEGLSKCHENDNFNRKLGRTIALGRAEFAAKVARGEVKERLTSAYNSENTFYSINTFGDTSEVDTCIVEFFTNKQESAS